MALRIAASPQSSVKISRKRAFRPATPHRSVAALQTPPEFDTHGLRFTRLSLLAPSEVPAFAAPPAISSATTPLVQAKLQIGAVNDPLEREADRVAERVMRMPDPKSELSAAQNDFVQRTAATVAQNVQQTLYRKCESCSEEEKKKNNEETHEKLSRKQDQGQGMEGALAPPIVGQVLQSPGQPLDADSRSFMESRFGYGFGQVRVHTDPAAAASAQAVHALAYTVGPHVVFASGQYQPGISRGRVLLAHELAHTIQQASYPRPVRGRTAFPMDRVTGSGPELGAPQAPVSLHSPTGPKVARQTKTGGDNPSKMPTAPTDCSSFFEGRQIAAFGGKAGPWKLDDLVKTIVPVLSTCELAYVMIDVVPNTAGDDPRQQAMDRAESVRRGLIQWIGPGKFSEDRFQTGFSTGNEQGAEVEVYFESRARVVSSGTTAGPSSRTPSPPKPIQGWQTVLSAGSQIAWHVSLATGKPASTPQDVSLQFQAARNFAGHPENESGSELQGLVQFGYNITTKQITVMSGVQYTEVFSLFNGLLQLAGFAQVLAGVAAGGGPAAGQIQPSIGGQAMVQVGKVQIGVMVFRGLTITPGGESTQDTGGSLGVQFSF